MAATGVAARHQVPARVAGQAAQGRGAVAAEFGVPAGEASAAPSRARSTDRSGRQDGWRPGLQPPRPEGGGGPRPVAGPRTIAWVSRCICSPRGPAGPAPAVDPGQDLPPGHRVGRPRRQLGAAIPLRHAVNKSTGTGSGARNAHSSASSAAAGSSAASRSSASWVAAASDRGYDGPADRSSSCPARVASRSRYCAGGHAGLGHVPRRLRQGQRQVTQLAGQPTRLGLRKPGHPVCAGSPPTRPGPAHPPPPAPRPRPSRASREVISTCPPPPGSHPRHISGPLGVVEDQQPPPPLPQLGQHRRPHRLAPRPGLRRSPAPRPARRTGPPISPACSALTHQARS